MLALAGWSAASAGAWALTEGVIADVLGPLTRGGPSAVAALPFDDVLLGLCAAVLVASVAWLLVTGTIAAVAHLCDEVSPHSRSVRALCRVNEHACPPWVRRLVGTVLGAALSTGLATVPAVAAAPSQGDRPAPAWPGRTGLAGPTRPEGPTGPTGLTGLSVPDRATDAGRPVGDTVGSGRTARRPRAAAATSVVVRPGQCLWSIAENLLTDGLPDPLADQRPQQRAGGAADRRARPPSDVPSDQPNDQPSDQPSDREITAAWHRLHRVNAERIGADPDLILPGTRLVVPELTLPH